ncbi:hypothetical protein HID58_096124, partial [Brassica napus]
WRSNLYGLEFITGSRKKSNFAGLYPIFRFHWDSYWLELPVILLHLRKSFFSQGIVMSFYGIAAGLFISAICGCNFWNVGSGYDLSTEKRRDSTDFRWWGFPGKKPSHLFYDSL